MFFATFSQCVGDSKRSKSAIFAVLAALNFDFDGLLPFERAKTYQSQTPEILNLQQKALFDLLTPQKLYSRKN